MKNVLSARAPFLKMYASWGCDREGAREGDSSELSVTLGQCIKICLAVESNYSVWTGSNLGLMRGHRLLIATCKSQLGEQSLPAQ